MKKSKTKKSKKTKKALVKKSPKTHARKGARHNKKSLRLATFLAKFFIIYIILTIIVELLDLSLLTNWLAYYTSSFIGMQAIGNIIVINGQKFVVSNSCTGLISASILAAVIFSLKKPELKKKIIFFLGGLIILLLVNIPRIILVLIVAKMGLNAELVHILTWFLMSGVILLLWYYGTKEIFGIKDFSELI